MTFYSRQQQEQEAKEKREETERKYAALEYGYEDQQGHLTHHTWLPKKKQSDGHPWISRAEERAQQEKDLAATQEARRLDALEHGYYEDMKVHHVPVKDLASPSAHTQRTRKPMKPLLSSTYMVCTQAALNTSGLAPLPPLPNFVEKLQHLETQVGTLQQQIQDIDTMRNDIKNMGYKLTQFENLLQLYYNQMQPRKTFRRRGAAELRNEDSEGLKEYHEALAHARQNNYEILEPI
jgi:hypothetical protein